MNVRGAFPDGFAEDLIDETHHGRLLVVFQNGHFLTQGVMFCLVHFALDQFIKARRSHAIPGAERLEDGGAGREDPSDILVERLASHLPGLEVKRIIR